MGVDAELYQIVKVMYFWGVYSCKEIADEFDISEELVDFIISH